MFTMVRGSFVHNQRAVGLNDRQGSDAQRKQRTACVGLRRVGGIEPKQAILALLKRKEYLVERVRYGRVRPDHFLDT